LDPKPHGQLKLNKVFFYYSYTALIALGIRQEVKQMRANVFCSTFLNVFFYFCRVFTL